MKITLDTADNSLRVSEAGQEQDLSLYSPESFSVLSRLWIKLGWSLKYTYSFTWMGRPIIQLPEDIVRVQEVIYQLKPDILIETGVAHGGSLILYASLFKAMERGRVVGVDVEIRPHNRKAIEEHPSGCRCHPGGGQRDLRYVLLITADLGVRERCFQQTARARQHPARRSRTGAAGFEP